MPKRPRRPVSLPPERLGEFGSDPMVAPSISRQRRRLPALEPMTAEAQHAATAWIAARLVPAPRRLSVAVLARTWRDHATSLAIKPGTRSELVKLILAAHPSARIRAARSGRDVNLGAHIEGVALQ